MIARSNLLIIGSTGRNTGKTEFACRIIERLSPRNEIVGIKVVPVDKEEGNCHRGDDGCGLCNSLRGEFRIIEEETPDTLKDTSRMLKAGAGKVYLLLVERTSLERGMAAILSRIPDHAGIIVESNSVRKVVQPGLFLVIKKLPEHPVKPSCAEVIGLADRIVECDNLKWNLQPQHVSLMNMRWVLTEEPKSLTITGQNG